MPLTASGEMEPEKPNRAAGEVSIRITVPEEFVGASQQELVARRGLITGMEAKGQSLVIHASLPVGEYDGLVEAIAAGTQGRGKIDQTN